MTNQKRRYTRISRPVTVQYCPAGRAAAVWDQSVVLNISAGGVKFLALTALDLKDKIIRLRIKIPELAPRVLDLQAMVLEFKPMSNPKVSELRAKFINDNDTQNEQLLILGQTINKKKMP